MALRLQSSTANHPCSSVLWYCCGAFVEDGGFQRGGSLLAVFALAPFRFLSESQGVA